MIKPSALLLEFEARYAREAYRGLSYPAALALDTGLWMEAQSLNPDAGDDWERDLASGWISSSPPRHTSSRPSAGLSG